MTARHLLWTLHHLRGNHGTVGAHAAVCVSHTHPDAGHPGQEPGEDHLQLRDLCAPARPGHAKSGYHHQLVQDTHLAFKEQAGVT